jgi:outer membrane protein TolC
MKIHFSCLVLLFSVVLTLEIESSKADTLTIKQAVTLAALQNDPSVTQYIEQAESAKSLAVAQGQLPDPKIKFGVANIAADHFRLTQEPMTQLKFGLHQSFTLGRKRSLIKQRGMARSESFKFMALKQAAILEMLVKRIWLNIYYLERASELITVKSQHLTEILKSMKAQFETGQMPAQKIIMIQAETALLTDRGEEFEQAIKKSRILLARYIGQEASLRPLFGGYDDLKAPHSLTFIERKLRSHPDLRIDAARIKAGEKAVAIAHENYKPRWGVDLSYGQRGARRPDLASAMITLTVPIFTAKRQDKKLLSAQHLKQSSILTKKAKELDMLRDLRLAHMIWQQSNKRIKLYRSVILERRKSASEITQNAYASGISNFSEIVRMQIFELDAKLKLEAIRLERAFAQIELIYFEGDAS